MTRATRTEVLGYLEELLRNFQGREYSGELSEGTCFFADLNFSSIDAVVLGEILETYFAQQLPFQNLLAELAAAGATDVTIGQIADFVVDNLES